MNLYSIAAFILSLVAPVIGPANHVPTGLAADSLTLPTRFSRPGPNNAVEQCDGSASDDKAGDDEDYNNNASGQAILNSSAVIRVLRCSCKFHFYRAAFFLPGVLAGERSSRAPPR